MTDTDDVTSSTEESDAKESKESTPKKHWYDFLLTWFNAGNNDTDSDTKETQPEVKKREAPSKKSNKQSENSQAEENSQSEAANSEGEASNSKTNSTEDKADKGNLGYVTYDIENANNNSNKAQDNSFDNLVQ